MDGRVQQITADRCWVCGSEDLEIFREGNLPTELSSTDFRITDDNYGVTGDLHRCPACGFLQCSGMPAVLSYYEELEDPEYVQTAAARIRQAHSILRYIQDFRDTGRLLDVGAGCGFLVSEALRMGYAAEGVEPSRWLQARARDEGLPVRLGLLSELDSGSPYDVVTLIDVIEHVDDPLQLLKEIRRRLAPDGILAVVTPDVSSLVARLLGKRWWHFRPAHIGYFNRRTLRLACETAGFREIATSHAGWYFPAEYVAERIKRYLPGGRRLPAVAFLRRWTLPLRLRDSILAVYRRV